MTLRVIHAGVGGRGEWPLRLMRDDPAWQSVALVDVNPAALQVAAREAGLDGERCFATLEAALHGVEADAVAVVTPSALHGHLVRQALLAGKHVLVEKPFVHDYDEACALVDLAEQANVRLVVAQNYRFMAPERTLRRLLAEGAFGPPGYSSLIHHRYRPQPRAFTMPHAMLLEMSVHHFDDMRAVFGLPPLAITARSFNPPWSAYPGAAAVQAVITFQGGLECCYEGTFTSHDDRFEWRIECRDAALCWHSAAPWEAGTLYAVSGGQRWPLEMDSVPGPAEQCILDAWRAYIEHGSEPEISGRANLGTMAMLAAAMVSSQEGRTVEVTAGGR
jgi:predicted dehydrogenase